MSKAKPPVTPAVRALRAAGVAFTDHLYDYEDKGGTAVSARELGVDEHSVVKTLVMEDDRGQPLARLPGRPRPGRPPAAALAAPRARGDLSRPGPSPRVSGRAPLQFS